MEFDALYRHLHYNGSLMGVDTYEASTTSASTWEFPLLLKYRFRLPVARPLLDAGAAWDTLAAVKQTLTQTVLPSAPVPTTTSNPLELRKSTTPGFVIGGGVDIHALFLHISPELRYTHWTSIQISGPLNALHSNQNQAEFLVDVTF